jgi:hypothetical protein
VVWGVWVEVSVVLVSIYLPLGVKTDNGEGNKAAIGAARCPVEAHRRGFAVIIVFRFFGLRIAKGGY